MQKIENHKENKVVKKLFSTFIVTLMVFVALSAASILFVPKVSAATVYVNIDGGADFTSIQDAINASSNGDTIYVYSGIYYENIDVNKSLYLRGEDRNTTIIDGGGSGNAVNINTSYVSVSNFSIKNASVGIYQYGFSFSVIENNTIFGNINYGIELVGSDYSYIFYNLIYNKGIQLWGSENNTITNNRVNETTIAINIEHQTSNNNLIYHNNFINNNIYCVDQGNNIWNTSSSGNYWEYRDEPDEGCWDNNSDGIIDQPYNIPGGSNIDYYPLANPWNGSLLPNGDDDNGTVKGYVTNITDDPVEAALVTLDGQGNSSFYEQVLTNNYGFYILSDNVTSGLYDMSFYKDSLGTIYDYNISISENTITWNNISFPGNGGGPGDNNPPNSPTQEVPPNGSLDRAIDEFLVWNCSDHDGDPLTFDVYLENSTPPPQVWSNTSNMSYYPGNLEYNTTYYWYIVAWDNNGSSTTGPSWWFRTRMDEGGPGPGPDENGTGTILGFVNNTQGEPLEGVTVMINRTDQGQPVEIVHTNDTGYYIFDNNVTEGLYDVEAWREGYEPHTINGVGVSENETRWVNFTLGSPGGPGGQGRIDFDEGQSILSPAYIMNNSQGTFNFTIKSYGPEEGKIQNLTIIFPECFTYEGNNGTTVSDLNYTVYNTENRIVWEKTTEDGFHLNENENFWFNASSSASLGSDECCP